MDTVIQHRVTLVDARDDPRVPDALRLADPSHVIAQTHGDGAGGDLAIVVGAGESVRRPYVPALCKGHGPSVVASVYGVPEIGERLTYVKTIDPSLCTAQLIEEGWTRVCSDLHEGVWVRDDDAIIVRTELGCEYTDGVLTACAWACNHGGDFICGDLSAAGELSVSDGIAYALMTMSRGPKNACTAQWLEIALSLRTLLLLLDKLTIPTALEPVLDRRRIREVVDAYNEEVTRAVADMPGSQINRRE